MDSSIDQNIPEHAAPVSAEQAETRSLLRGAVEKLADDERVPVTLCFYEGLTVAQAARTLELPRETVRARLGRALERLKAKLRKHGRDESTAALVAILWSDSAVTAPESLKLALDAVLPGRPCAQIPTVPPAPLDTALLQVGWPVALKAAIVAGIAVVTVSATLVLVGKMPGTAAPKPFEKIEAVAPVAVIEKAKPAAPPQVEKVQEQPEQTPAIVPDEKPEPVKEEVEMKSSVAKIVLAGAAVLPFAVSAGEPNADVAAVLKQIESRQTEKAAAAAKNPTSLGSPQGNPGGAVIQSNGGGAWSPNTTRAGQSSRR